jgi:adenine-specific DNA-methyltransferase
MTDTPQVQTKPKKFKFNVVKTLKEKKHEKGQYFTTNTFLKENVYNLIKNNPSIILEPSIGQGDLIDYIKKNRKDTHFHSYEIDLTIPLLSSIKNEKVVYGDFLEQHIMLKYDTIIGNPPYVKTQSGNLYLDFINKCYELLNDNGELIFIVPSDFIKLTSASKIINKMLSNGTFTHIIHPNNESLFLNASIDIIIFRYCKNNKLSNSILFNEQPKFLINTNGIITFSDNEDQNMTTLSEYFSIFVGMVTGKESVFKNEEYGNITILSNKNTTSNYILLEQFPTDNDKLNEYMLAHKSELISRKIKKFTDKNWYEWGALRNYKTITQHLGKECIYVNNMSRSKEICFKGTVRFFSGNLIIMIPTKKINLDKVVECINSDQFKQNYMYSGRFKIGHKQLCNGLFDVPPDL